MGSSAFARAFFWVKVSPSLPTASTGSFFFQNLMRPVRSNSFLYYSTVMRHLTDLLSLLLTQGATSANPTFFQRGLFTSSSDLWIILLMSLVFLGSSHSSTSEEVSMTGILSCTLLRGATASFVRIMISPFSEQSPATRKWSPSFGLKLKGCSFDFHSQQPSIITTHLFSIIFTKVRFSVSSSIRPLMIIFMLVLWPHFMKLTSLSSLCSLSSLSSSLFSILASCFGSSGQSWLLLMTGMQVVGHTLQEAE